MTDFGRALLGGFLLSTLGACAGPESEVTDPPWFREVAEQAGVNFVHRSGHRGDYQFPEIAAGGVCLLDADGDGDLDLYLVQSSRDEPNRIFRNDGRGRFTDSTSTWGAADLGYGMGCAVADVDADSDLDLFVTNVGRDVLYLNRGDGGFEEASRSGIEDEAWSASALFADFDGDGLPDLFVTRYVEWKADGEVECHTGGRRDYCSPNVYTPSRDALYRNLGDGAFEDVTERAGLDRAVGNGLGAVAGDFDADGRLDLFVANDGMANHLWMQRGPWRFEEEGLIAGVALNDRGVAEAGMGVAAGDPDRDGDLDLLLSHLDEETNTFYRNEGGFFTDMSARSGLGAPSLGSTGFGLAFADFDQDGWLDVYIANGGVKRAHHRLHPGDPYAEPDLVFRGLPGGRFEEVTPRGGTRDLLLATGRGAAAGDWSGDGAVDIVVAVKDGRPLLLENVVPRPGSWIRLALRDSRGVEPLGASLRIEAGEDVHWRWLVRGSGYCASHDGEIHVGLGRAEQVDRIVVRWPGPEVVDEEFGPFAVGRRWVLVRGEGA